MVSSIHEHQKTCILLMMTRIGNSLGFVKIGGHYSWFHLIPIYQVRILIPIYHFVNVRLKFPLVGENNYKLNKGVFTGRGFQAQLKKKKKITSSFEYFRILLLSLITTNAYWLVNNRKLTSNITSFWFLNEIQHLPWEYFHYSWPIQFQLSPTSW